MMSRFVLLSLSAGCLILLSAQAQPKIQPLLPLDINSEEAGQELAQRLRSSVPEQSTRITAILKTRSPDGQYRRIPLTFQILVLKDHWKAIYETQAIPDYPAERLTIIHRPDQPNEYSVSRDLSKGDPERLTADSAARPLAGSDFWLIDLGMDFLGWPSQRLIRTEMRKGRWCHVLESRLPSTLPSGYGRVLCWLDKEKGQPLLAEAYDPQDRLLKEFSIGSIKKVNGQWQVRDMKISNVQSQSRTWLEFEFELE